MFLECLQVSVLMEERDQLKAVVEGQSGSVPSGSAHDALRQTGPAELQRQITVRASVLMLATAIHTLTALEVMTYGCSA